MGRKDLQPGAASTMRVLAQGDGWRIRDVRCARGPQDRPFEEQHAGVSLALVLGGTFQYRSAQGRALLYPGAVLLGNAGACFECGHEHGSGDRCLAVSLDPELFQQIAAGTTGRSQLQLRLPMLPALRALARPVSRLQARIRTDPLEGTAEAVFEFAEAVLRTLSDTTVIEAPLAARDQRRLHAVIRHIETNSHEALDLDGLAARASMSKYHFLRRFRRALGLTPHQYLMQQRLRRAADALCSCRDPVSRIALDAGFGDLSSFNALFRAVYGVTPGAFRRETKSRALRFASMPPPAAATVS